MGVFHVSEIVQIVLNHAKHLKCNQIVDLTHFKPMFHLCTPWKYQKMFSGSIDMERYEKK